MAINTALSVLRSMVKAELGWSMSVGTQRDAELNMLISNAQKWFASHYDWAHLESKPEVAMIAATQYYALPTLNFERPVKVEVYFNTRWLPVEYGIGAEEYNSRNSGTGVTQDPIQRWNRYVHVAAIDQFEVWPIPATAATVRFTGQLVLPALTVDASKVVLDDLLIAYSVAAKLATAGKMANAEFLTAQAQTHENNIRNSYSKRDEACVLGGRRSSKPRTASIVIATA